MKHSGSGEKLIATNPSARSNFFIEDTFEAGLILTGTEIKSLRMASPNLRDAFVSIEGRKTLPEAYLLNAHIAPYTHGNIWNHDPLRKRKLLLNRREIDQLNVAVTQKGMTIVPLRLYLKKGRAKIEIGTAKGKKRHDKRQDIKERSADREIDRALKKSRNR